MHLTLRVGDLVLVTGPTDMPHDGLRLFGKVGTVKSLSDRSNRAGVEFPFRFAGHNLDGAIAENRGWWIDPARLTKLRPVPEVIREFFNMA